MRDEHLMRRKKIFRDRKKDRGYGGNNGANGMMRKKNGKCNDHSNLYKRKGVSFSIYSLPLCLLNVPFLQVEFLLVVNTFTFQTQVMECKGKARTQAEKIFYLEFQQKVFSKQDAIQYISLLYFLDNHYQFDCTRIKQKHSQLDLGSHIY